MKGSWAEWSDHLRTELQALPNGGFVAVTVQRPLWPAVKRGLLRSRKRGEEAAYVQFLNNDGYLYAECSGASDFGGPLELPADVRAQLTQLGWQEPTGDDNTDNYLRWFTPDEDAAADRAAALAADTLRDAFRAAGPHDLDIGRGP